MRRPIGAQRRPLIAGKPDMLMLGIARFDDGHSVQLQQQRAMLRAATDEAPGTAIAAPERVVGWRAEDEPGIVEPIGRGEPEFLARAPEMFLRLFGFRRQAEESGDGFAIE